MPQAIPFAIAAAASNAAAAAGATVAAQATIAATAATIAASVQTTALLLGASYVIARLTAPDAPKPSDGSVELRQPLPVRFYTYGPMPTSGPVALLETAGSARLHKITLFGTRKLGSIQVFLVHGKEVTLDGGGSAGIGNDASFINTHLGADSQVADADAVAGFTPWTSAHRLRGIPYAYLSLDSDDPQDFQHTFPNGEPVVSIVGGVEIYDPRKDSTNGGSGSHRMNNPASWEYSANQRLICLDWLTWKDGYKKPFARIDWESWLPQIEMADDAIPLKAGGTEPRYQCATKVSLDEPKSRVLHRIMDVGDQQLFMTNDGLIGSRGGVWQAPTVNLTSARLPEGQFTSGVPVMDRANEFQLTAMLPNHKHTEVDLEPWIFHDDDYANGIVRRGAMDFSAAPSGTQAQRLAKIKAAKMNPGWSGSVRTDFSGLDVRGQLAVNLSVEVLDQPGEAFDGPFWISGRVMLLEDRSGVTFACASADPSSYDWDKDTDEMPLPIPPEDDE